MNERLRSATLELRPALQTTQPGEGCCGGCCCGSSPGVAVAEAVRLPRGRWSDDDGEAEELTRGTGLACALCPQLSQVVGCLDLLRR